MDETTEDEVFAIGERHGLDDADQAFLVDAVEMVLEGKRRREDFSSLVGYLTFLENDVIENVGKEINDVIFEPNRNKLKELSKTAVKIDPPKISGKEMQTLIEGLGTADGQAPDQTQTEGSPVPKLGNIQDSKVADIIDAISNPENISPLGSPVESTKTAQKHSVVPKDVEEAILSVDKEEIVRSIGKKHQLHIDETGLLLEVVKEVFSGSTKTRDLEEALRSRLNDSNDKAGDIVHDLERQVFSKISASLKEKQVSHKVDDRGGLDTAEESELRDILHPVSESVSAGSDTANTTRAIVHPPILSPPGLGDSMQSAKDELLREDGNGSISGAQEVSVEEKDLRLNMIPSDVKDRIKNDPYKESI